MPIFVNLNDAKAEFSSLIDRAASGEEIVIVANGVPRARLVAVALRGQRRTPANAMRIEYLASGFDEPDPHIEGLFEGDVV